MIERYAKAVPRTALTTFIALMPPRASVTGDLVGFGLWRREASVSALLNPPIKVSSAEADVTIS